VIILDELLNDLKKHKNTPEYYYSVRALDPGHLSPVERASRFLYLNKTGYNGLWRVNSRGKHNVPFGRYKNPKIVDETNLRLLRGALSHARVIGADFSRALDFARGDAFVYLDPPYYPVSDTANFTGYISDAFGIDDQKRLAEVFPFTQNDLHSPQC
jgi:DNA adenine methylase